jgi:hypothetical protein
MLTAVSNSLQTVFWLGTPVDMELHIDIGIVPINTEQFYRFWPSLNCSNNYLNLAANIFNTLPELQVVVTKSKIKIEGCISN